MQEPHTTTRSTGRPSEPVPQSQPCPDLMVMLRDYAREKPEVAALWCLGIGFVLGWKLKPW